MVESETMIKPHYVTVTKNGKVTCNDCPGWNAYNICSPSLAVAEKSGRTVDYLKWLRTKGPQQMNLTSLITSDSNKGVGKKTCKTSTRYGVPFRSILHRYEVELYQCKFKFTLKYKTKIKSYY